MMRYELQTTLGVVLEDGETFERVIERLHDAMESVLAEPTYASVSAFRVAASDTPLEVVVGIRFDDGMRAEYVDETATEILMNALEVFSEEDVELREESVRLQAVYA